MWRPQTEAEIQAGIDNGIVHETSTFDAKLRLPARGRNTDLAKDICAMTVDGGVLLYGLGGDDPIRPDRREPFDLTGAAERIDQVAQAGIAEPRVIEIHDIASDEQPGTGYLSVVIPGAPRAPHMLTINGDNRYWGRDATGNRILSEGEVARLYARRERWEEARDRQPHVPRPGSGSPCLDGEHQCAGHESCTSCPATSPQQSHSSPLTMPVSSPELSSPSTVATWRVEARDRVGDERIGLPASALPDVMSAPTPSSSRQGLSGAARFYAT